jgi:hypothetical protein
MAAACLDLSASLPATNAKRLRKGALATKQSILPLAVQWIASLALAMTVDVRDDNGNNSQQLAPATEWRLREWRLRI